MLRKSPSRLLLACLLSAFFLSIGALPAAALQGFDSSPIRLDAESWFDRLWRTFGEPVVSLFAADETPPPAPAPPLDNSGISIDPDGPRI